ncbi:DNA-processing protein DprA [Algihabitans albus]|uniref:DNA-processing protein DprA n=1 Tax=Algihabitans albus TaxID=2164067 RepID=UPI000E5D33D4|nr:DNA-processing protein DprA [Algihabitans albus]
MSPTAQSLTDGERLDWLRLSRSENVGPITFRLLLERFGSATAALEALPELAKRGGQARPIRVCPAATAERELADLARLEARTIALCEPDYPQALAAADDAPPLVVLRGQAQLLRRPAVAIVGARNASANGRTLAKGIAGDLARAGYLVVSGFARGIDTAAHEGALTPGPGAGEAGAGTLAVLAGGVDIIYPAENGRLYDRLLTEGALLSEMPPGREPQGRHFPRRNRIIAGLSLGVVVVEAALRSGSLHTARLAADYGRDVMAVPGSPLDPRAKGCNGLLRQGATLIESAADVLEALAGSTESFAEAPNARFEAAPMVMPSSQEQLQATDKIMELLSPSPISVDELIRQCQLSAALVGTVLLELELAGRLERTPGNRVALIA